MRFFQPTSLEKYKAPGVPQRRMRRPDIIEAEAVGRDERENTPPTEPGTPQSPLQESQGWWEEVRNWLPTLKGAAVWGLVAAVAIIFLISYLMSGEEKTAQGPTQDIAGYPCPSTFIMVITKEWSPIITRPKGCHHENRRQEPFGYEMVATTERSGDVLNQYKAGHTQSYYTPDIVSFRLRLLQEETAEEGRVKVTFYR